ncbi:Sec-independent protein translocase protein TatA (modular protein) [Verrucomicrobia bacterium]|nr:Sec-independent protein translocase protein TatA (modular protein) [Verrucomicrobiota bacterium]
MSLAALQNLDGGEIILLLALTLAIFAARKLLELAEGFRQGIREFRKATQEIAEEVAEQLDGNGSSERPSHPILMAMTLILGAIGLILVMYEFSK